MEHSNATYGVVEGRRASPGSPQGLPLFGVRPEDFIKEAGPVAAALAWPCVLVVDDGAVDRMLAVRLLARLGVKADVARDAREALEAVVRLPYGAVLMDRRMPGMDGLEATRELRRREGGRVRLPVVALTAEDDEEDRRACLEAGMDGHAAKPLRSADLARAVRAWTAPVYPEDMRMSQETREDDPGALRARTREYLESGTALTALLRSAAAAADRGALLLAARSLRGASLSFGARPLSGLCARLESMAEAGRVLACAPFASAAAWEFERVRQALSGAAVSVA
ncbi:MAG TPA: hypothetical protein DCZ01_02460 [Elusimicrobia bacterium]|nr:MAG: hypothetical protein A2X37_09945 [Elusimicrobia bacterium GWA2_66_18]HAZ07391.1 hypothetical protein [Elusimicrobiota bacterium]